MKRVIRTVTVFLLIAAMCLSLCSFNVFKTNLKTPIVFFK